MFPNNIALRKIAQKRSLEIVDLSPDELKEVEDSEDQSQMMAQQQPTQQPAQPLLSAPKPQLPLPA